MTRQTSILSVGTSPSSIFLAWRLASSEATQVAVAWPKPHTVAYVSSDKFGSHQFTPQTVYDSARLTTEITQGYDFVLVSPTTCRELAALATTIDKAVVPDHTVILVDTSAGVSPIQRYLETKFARNPVRAILTDSPLCRVHSDPSTLRVLHSTLQSSTYLEPLRLSSPSLRGRYRELAMLLKAAAVETTELADETRFVTLQWERAIPFIAFQPLSIIFDTPNLDELSRMLIAKPIYRGIISELLRLAASQGAEFGRDYVQALVADLATKTITPTTNITVPTAFSNLASSAASVSSADSSSSSLERFPLADAPLMYYNFFHHLPTNADIVLLQPIIEAEKARLKTPYLEATFAFLSQLASLDVKCSSLFQRRACTTTQPAPPLPPASQTSMLGGSTSSSSNSSTASSSSSSPASSTTISSCSSATPPPNNASTNHDDKNSPPDLIDPFKRLPAPNSTIDDHPGTHRRRMSTLEAREEALARREQALYQREKELYRRGPQKTPSPLSTKPPSPLSNAQPSNGPLPPPNGLVPGHPSRPPPRQMSLNNLPSYALKSAPSYDRTPPENLDMMSLTSRRNSYRRSTMSVRNSLSRASSQPTVPFSQQLDLDDVASLKDSRYGTVAVNSRRLSSPVRPPSRTNSITSTIHGLPASQASILEGQVPQVPQIASRRSYSSLNSHYPPAHPAPSSSRYRVGQTVPGK
ncbi:hypothetical protein TRVA0_001S08064 [Trichomonascus vanleenenianus]|uniref:uncharacterized protein n=1 Tax=Trichomonascus vanleenenianus TaxID=2268995 RepID=UPI003ECB4EA7